MLSRIKIGSFFILTPKFSFSFTKIPLKFEKNKEDLQNLNTIEARLIKINDPKFIEKIIKIEEEEKAKPYLFSLANFKIPMLMLFISGFLLHLWVTCPRKVVFKHATISKLSIEKRYWHSFAFAPLSFRNYEKFIMYFPIMTYSLIILNKYLNPYHFFFFYAVNSVIVDLIAYNTLDKNFKCLGSCTSLAFLAFLTGVLPQHRIIYNKIPFIGIGFAYFIYEIGMLFGNKQEAELNRTANLASILFGISMGIIFKTKKLK